MVGLAFNKPFRVLAFLAIILTSHTDVADDSGETPPLNLNDHDSGGGDIATTAKPTSPPPLSPSPTSWESNEKPRFSSFKPSVAVIVGVLTTMFSLIFLLLLYAKHCKRGSVVIADYNRNPHLRRGGGQTSSARKNSGINRSVIESLPIFRFGSLRGQKDGLECAVCLNRFEPTEVLRLLPKCKHAFHVECVDTWLDAHSTCPLCRYRVDPEDILLVEDARILHQNQPIPPPPPQRGDDEELSDIESGRNGAERELQSRDDSDPGIRRVSGRHSSAGERGSRFLQIILPRPSSGGSDRETNHDKATASLRRSLDSVGWRKRSESVGFGCFDRPRKDGLLLTVEKTRGERRLEHRIIVSPISSGFHQRWSDVQPSDLLYLRTEMIISDSRRLTSGLGHGRSESRTEGGLHGVVGEGRNSHNINEGDEEDRLSGRGVINSRSVSEITGLSRFSDRESEGNHMNSCRRHRRYRQERQRQVGVVSR